ncbi:MAG: HNH endonuclease [Roseiflexaceae bacterium]
MSLDQYKRAFSKLRSDVKAYWPATTLHRAPHKPFLLLSIMDLMANDRVQTNFFQLGAELIDTFNLYWEKIIGNNRESNILMPFYHMTSEGFWHLIPSPGMEQALASIGKIKSYRQFNQVALGAKLNDNLFVLLSASDTRDALRRALIEKYFAPDIRAEIVNVGRITTQSFEYSRELIDRLKGRFTLKEAPEANETYLTDSRTVAFRRVVVEAYQHTCSFCRIRVRTPDGHTAVAAAHIVPWSHGHNDDPRNGMALCGLHHWAFDRGLISVEDYKIRVSPVATSDDNAAPSILELDGRPIYLPNEQMLWPAKSALRWHIENIFWDKVPPRLL